MLLMEKDNMKDIENQANEQNKNNIIQTVKGAVLVFKSKIKPFFLKLDEKFTVLIPNPKLRKISYIMTGLLFGFMFLIILLGLLLSPMSSNTKATPSLFKKPETVSSSPKPQVELSKKQVQIGELQTKINEMKFPESILNIPIIESELKI